jgi:type IV secretory pathway VirB2 component (pilin)
METSKVLLVFLILLASLAQSTSPPDWQNFDSEVVPTFQAVLCIIYIVMWKIAGPIAVLVLVWAGLKWVYAKDNASEREGAKEMVINTIMALMLLLISKALAEFILSKSGAPIVFACTL